MNEVTITERGWAGHFIAASKCLYRRNTLISKAGKHLVVSSVGAYRNDNGKLEPIGHERWYETMIFKAGQVGPYIDPTDWTELHSGADVPWGIFGTNADELPDDVDNIMDAQHNAIVQYTANHFEETYQNEQ